MGRNDNEIGNNARILKTRGRPSADTFPIKVRFKRVTVNLLNELAELRMTSANQLIARMIEHPNTIKFLQSELEKEKRK